MHRDDIYQHREVDIYIPIGSAGREPYPRRHERGETHLHSPWSGRVLRNNNYMRYYTYASVLGMSASG